jgi:hypothetical protein
MIFYPMFLVYITMGTLITPKGGRILRLIIMVGQGDASGFRGPVTSITWQKDFFCEYPDGSYVFFVRVEGSLKSQRIPQFQHLILKLSEITFFPVTTDY